MRKIISAVQSLRHRCVLAHNFLFQESGYSTIGALKDALHLDDEPLPRSPEHLFLSSYAFWGAEKVGDSRAGFERRLQRFGEDQIWKLHIRMKLVAHFAAWECVDGDHQSSRWINIGPDTRQEERTIHLITDVTGEPIDPAHGQCRAGWLLEMGALNTLLFSLPISKPGAAKLRQTAAKNGWAEPSAGEPVVEEYERDVIIQTLEPGRQECGLHEFYFLPPHLRGRFPQRFQQQCPQEVTRYIRTTWDELWHIYLAMQTGEERPQELRQAFVPIRQRATRSAFYYYNTGKVDDEILKKLVSDEDFFRILGLNDKGEVSLEAFQPLLAHPLRALDLQEHFFEETGLTGQTTVQQAQRELADKEPWRGQFELALIDHQRRLGWASLIWGAREAGVEVELDYTELRLVAEKIFGPPLLTRQLEEVISRAAARRITRALAEEVSESPLRVLHLPEHRYELSSYPGIGDGTIQAVCEGLEAAMLDHGARLLANNNFEEAQEEIDAGLDELAALFE